MSALWIGRRESIGIGVESTRGVGVAPTFWLNVLSFNFADRPTRAKSEAGFGGIWGGDQAPLTLSHAEGDMEVELGDQSWGAILKSLLGTLSTSTDDPGSGDNTHTYTLQNDNVHDSLSIHTLDPIGDFIFEMGMINSLELTVNPDSIITYSVNFISKPSQDSTGQTASYGAEKKFTGRNLTLKVAALTSGLAAASAVSVKSFRLTFDKNAEVQATLGTIHPEDIVNKRFMITGEVTLNYEDRTWLNYVKNASYQAMRIDILDTANISGGTVPAQFTLDLSKCMFEEWEPDFALDDVVTQTTSFEALYDAGLNDNVINSCQLINGVTSY